MIRYFQAPMTRVEQVGLAVGLILAAVLMAPLSGYVTDDTYIHLQYARHLAHGQGLVFNAGERVYGCTSPLWVALIADGIALGFDGLLVARVLGGLATLASVALFLQLARRTMEQPVLRALATVAWASHAWMLRWSLSGMETPLAVALTLAGFVAFTEGRLQWGARPVRTGALWGLASLARPEAVFLLVLWGTLLIADTQNRAGIRRLVFGLIPSIAIYGSWLLFARVYFGAFWPLTLSAKTVGPHGAEEQLSGLWRQIQIVGATDGVLLVILVVAVLAVRRRLWPNPMTAQLQSLLPWIWVVALPALYVARGVPVISRYLLLVLPVMGWLAWRSLERWMEPAEGAPRLTATRAVVGALVAFAVVAQNLAVYRSAVLPQVRTFTAGLEGSLVTWGRWFARHTPEDASIASPDIGAIGYFSERRVVDLAGLVTPQMIPILGRQQMEEAVAEFRFASFARPVFLVDRADRAHDLKLRSRFGACLEPVGTATVPNLGIARPGRVIYTFYRIDWAQFDSMQSSMR